MTKNLDQLRERASHPKALHGCSSDPCGSVVCQTARDRDTLLDRVEAAEAALASQRGVVKTLAERNVELTKFKDAYSLQAQELETAEAAVQRVREVLSEWDTDEDSKGLHFDVSRALDGGEQK